MVIETLKKQINAIDAIILPLIYILLLQINGLNNNYPHNLIYLIPTTIFFWFLGKQLFLIFKNNKIDL